MKGLSYIKDARCLKVKVRRTFRFSPQLFISEIFLVLRRIQRHVIINVHMYVGIHVK